MWQGCKHIAVCMILLLAYTVPYAQVSIRVSTDRNKILIGEPISLTVDAYVPLGTSVTWFATDSIPHFYVIDRLPPDTANGIDGKKVTQRLTITSFDSGRWQIPPFEVIAGGQPYYSDSLSIDVAFASFDPRDDYRDIKDIVIVSTPSLKYIPWIIAIAAVAALVLVILLWRKKKRAAAPVADTPLLSAYEEAVKALELLRKKGVLPGGEKAYYSSMNDILRNFVSRKFGISTFERTNEELIEQLANIHLPREAFMSLTQSLRMSDFVKFAKYRPSEKDNLDNLNIIRSSVDLLNTRIPSAV
jgi:hypothetical protein